MLKRRHTLPDILHDLLGETALEHGAGAIGRALLVLGKLSHQHLGIEALGRGARATASPVQERIVHGRHSTAAAGATADTARNAVVIVMRLQKHGVEGASWVEVAAAAAASGRLRLGKFGLGTV